MNTLAIGVVAEGHQAVRRRRRVKGLRTPPGVWRWFETAAVAAAAVLLMIALLTLDVSEIDPVDVTRRVTILGSVLAVAASVLLYVHWRLASGGTLGWLILGLMAMSVHLLTMATIASTDPQRVAERPGLVLVTRLVLTVGVLLLVAVASRGVSLDPLMAGFGLGALLFSVRYAVLVLVPRLDLPDHEVRQLALVVFLLDMCIAVGVAAYPRVPRWVRYRMAAALACLAVAHTTTYPAPSFGWYGATVAVVGQLAAATILLSLSVCLVRRSIRDNRSAFGILQEQLLRIEGLKRTEQARLHEIRATIAGISHAAQLIHDHRGLAPSRRAAMSDMMTSEIGRLERLTCEQTHRTIEPVDVASTLEPLVTRLVALGHRIHLRPTREVVLGNEDCVAEIVNVLLENAVRHGRGAAVVVGCRRLHGPVGDRVEITVSDAGPGVPAALRDRIFEWGVSGADSSGDGIGLHIARELSLEMGGDLELASREGRGATFVLTLPAAAGDTSG
jgi:signal transduction histidine kinase